MANLLVVALGWCKKRRNFSKFSEISDVFFDLKKILIEFSVSRALSDVIKFWKLRKSTEKKN
jgi:hypothetical protein